MARKRLPSKLHLLSVREVQTAPDGDHSDGGGLLLRVRGESASWVLRYTASTGRRREMGLGAVHRGSAKQAGDAITSGRDEAHKARELLRQGIDPITARERSREVDRQAEVASKAKKAQASLTLARAARCYHERVVEKKRTTKHAAQWIASLENHVPPAIWHAPIDSITPAQLLEGLRQIGHHERARNVMTALPLETIWRIRQRLGVIFEDAQFHGNCASNPARAIIAKLREELPEKVRGSLAALPYKEAPALLQRIRAMPGTSARCLEFAVLTASRTSEALEAVWSEFDLEGRLWAVPAARMKGGEDHVVPLSARVLEILQGQRGQDPIYVFPSTQPSRAGRAMSNMSLLATLGRLGVRDKTTTHGLCRSTFSTWANDVGAARPDVIEAALAHNEADRVRKAYNRAQFSDERRALLEAWAEYLSKPPVTAAVIEFKAA